MKREGVGCRAFAVDEGEIRERNSLPASQLENNFSRKNGRCINPRNPRVREGKRAGKLLVPAPFLNFHSPLPPKKSTTSSPPFTSSFIFLFLLRYYVLSAFSFSALFLSFLSFSWRSRNEENEKSSGGSLFLLFWRASRHGDSITVP